MMSRKKKMKQTNTNLRPPVSSTSFHMYLPNYVRMYEPFRSFERQKKSVCTGNTGCINLRPSERFCDISRWEMFALACVVVIVGGLA